MKRCLSCNEHYASLARSCPSCGFLPALIDGFDSYAPDFAYESSGFRSNYFSELASLEESNFWFRSRNQLILWALKKYCPHFKSFLEIGCGTGYVLSGVSKQFQDSKLHGSEIFVTGLGFAAARLPSANFIQMDARNIPFKEEFDVIGAFDVLEHIEEDGCTLAQIHAALKPDGCMLLTVPQHPWLWSAMDEHACHVRRYTASDLHQKIEKTGFRIIRSTSFVTTLLPVMMVSRFLQKKMSDRKFDITVELKISPWLNFIFLKLLGMERMILKGGFNFSVGGSRLLVARKV